MLVKRWNFKLNPNNDIEDGPTGGNPTLLGVLFSIILLPLSLAAAWDHGPVVIVLVTPPLGRRDMKPLVMASILFEMFQWLQLSTKSL